MKESKGHAEIQESGTKEKKFPSEYVMKAKALVEKRENDEKELRGTLKPCGGRDDRLSKRLRELDMQLQQDLASLRRAYGIES